MRIVVASVQVPFITGGAELHARSLQEELAARGHDVRTVTIPFKWYPAETLRGCMDMASLVDLTAVNGEPIDRVIALKFPMYYLSHPAKTVWLLHQHRQAYDLWDTEHGDLHRMPGGEELRREIVRRDTAALAGAERLFTNSATVSARLERFNGIKAEPLYHPPHGHEQIHGGPMEDFVLYPSRIDPIKRQTLLAQAASLLRSSLRVVITGGGSRAAVEELHRQVRDAGVASRVSLLGQVSRRELLDLLARCRAVYFGGRDEDYGYVPLEGMLAGKPVVVHDDAGGPLEFVRHRSNGYVVPAEPGALAAALDVLSLQPDLALRVGRQGRLDMDALDLSWDRVIARLIG